MKCELCGKELPKEHAWAKIRAHSDGWFFSKDGTAWCPDHNPEWVAEWRAKQKTTPHRAE
jgi:hypothetical protein